MRRLEKFFPPGYEYKVELRLAGALWGGTVGVSILWFALDLYLAIERLYQKVSYGNLSNMSGRKVLQEGVWVEAFAELVGWYWELYLPALLFLAIMPLYHYFYYYRDSRSIYVMRRLPGKGITFKSCVQGSALEAGIVLASAVLLYFLYYGIYCYPMWCCGGYSPSSSCSRPEKV